MRTKIIFQERDNTYHIVLNGQIITSVHTEMVAKGISEAIEKAIDVWERTK